MKKFSLKKLSVALLLFYGDMASGHNYLVLHEDVTKDGVADLVTLADNETDYYTLRIFVGGNEILRNERLIPKRFRTAGGMDVWQGLSVVDGDITIRYRFCSPSSNVCYFRSLVNSFIEGKFLFTREESVVSADKISLTDIFYKKNAIPLEALDFESLLEENNDAEQAFELVYGKCVVKLGGDSLLTIADELEKDPPGNWVMKQGCVTPALVFAMQAQSYISHKAAFKYLDAYEKAHDDDLD